MHPLISLSNWENRRRRIHLDLRNRYSPEHLGIYLYLFQIHKMKFVVGVVRIRGVVCQEIEVVELALEVVVAVARLERVGHSWMGNLLDDLGRAKVMSDVLGEVWYDVSGDGGWVWSLVVFGLGFGFGVVWSCLVFLSFFRSSCVSLLVLYYLPAAPSSPLPYH